MNICLVDVDSHHFPNLALMKLSAWHKSQGDTVSWYDPLFSRPDKIYASKVFSFTPDYTDYAPGHPEPVKGGTGYNLDALPDEIEAIQPDYSIYPKFKAAYGFLTRGCIRSCSWCIVPEKEGAISLVGDIESIAQGRRDVVLLDNNFLAAPSYFVTDQLEKAVGMKVKLDFNQGLDARLLTDYSASLLAGCQWIKYIRFSCDTLDMLPHIANAVEALRWFNYKKDVFVYVLARDVEETHERIIRMCEIDKRIIPFCQPYRDFSAGSEVSQELKDLARWCNVQSIRKTTDFKNYKQEEV